MVVLLILGLKFIIKTLVVVSTIVVTGFLILRLESKVKRVEKMCEKIRNDQRLAINKALDCCELVGEFTVDAKKLLDKLKPLCYQVELNYHTLYLCNKLDDKSFLLVTIYGDSNLVFLNYKIVIDTNSNKANFFGHLGEDVATRNLRVDFAQKLLKYTGAMD